MPFTACEMFCTRVVLFQVGTRASGYGTAREAGSSPSVLSQSRARPPLRRTCRGWTASRAWRPTCERDLSTAAPWTQTEGGPEEQRGRMISITGTSRRDFWVPSEQDWTLVHKLARIQEERCVRTHSSTGVSNTRPGTWSDHGSDQCSLDESHLMDLWSVIPLGGNKLSYFQNDRANDSLFTIKGWRGGEY